MTLSQKLTLLMHVFKLSNSYLARQIHVDASLVSRWKSGSRTLSPQSPHGAALATFFIQTDAFPYQKAYLTRLLDELMRRDSRQASETDRIFALAHWFVTEEPFSLPEQLPVPLFAEQTDQMIHHIDQWLMSGADQAADSSPQPQAIQTPNHWQKPPHKLTGSCYVGLSGRRTAILTFLDETIELASPTDLLLFSEESMNWLTEDPAFMSTWSDKLRMVIESGHRITIIHVVNRGSQEIIDVINQWLPLHLTGQIRSYYDTSYNSPTIKQSIFITRGKRLLVSQSTDGLEASVLSFAYDDELVLDHYTRLFEAYLKQCRPLFNGYIAASRQAYLEMIHAVKARTSRVLSLLQQPDSDTLPAAIRQQLDPQAGQLESKPSERIDMVPLDWLSQGLREGLTVRSDCDLFLDQPVRLTTAQALDWLHSLIRRLKTDPSYHLYWLPGNLQHKTGVQSIRYFQHQLAVFSSALSPQPFVMTISETNCLYALDLHLEGILSKLPNSLKSRQASIKKLTDAIQKLQVQGH